jgi:cell wall-active antibiotic response 4TMS protein YvqF
VSTAYTTPPPSPSAAPGPNPYQSTVMPQHASPGLAFLLGLIPGLGAIYNGQYIKGLVHAAIIGVLFSLANATDGSSGEGFIIVIMLAFWGYMAFEAFHTAKNRQAGIPVDEFSSLIAPNVYRSRAPIGPVVLIVVGIFFLLETLGVLHFRELARFWPVLLIVAGCFMLYNRLTGLRSVRQPLDSMESSHEQ